MQKRLNNNMSSKIAFFSLLVLVALFVMATPLEFASAQTSNATPDGEGEYRDGDKEGKSCPSKEKKSASVNSSSNI